jgi:hypothetical protein
MNRVFAFFGIALLSIAFAFLVAKVSLHVGVEEKVVEKSKNEVRYATMRPIAQGEGIYEIEKTPFIPRVTKPSANTPILAEF